MSVYSDSDENFDYGGVPAQVEAPRRSERKRTQPEKATNSFVDVPSASEAEAEEEELEIDFWHGFLHPPVDQILAGEDSKFLVKFKGRSYLHLRWLTEDEISQDGRQSKLKLNRFVRDKLPFITEEPYFDPSFLEVDRVLYTTEIFPVVHPRQATLVAERWQGKCAQILSKLMNFIHNDVPVAVPFLQPVDQEMLGADEYFKKIKYPMDLLTIHNRLYNGYYVAAQEFWKDLGFVFKNCQTFYPERSTESRIMGDTLRDVAIRLYKLWQPLNHEHGSYTLRWLTQVPGVDVTSPEFLQTDIMPFAVEEEVEDAAANAHYLTEEQLQAITLDSETDKLFLVKWKNLSYAESTWEPESLLSAASKIGDFYRFNRALDPRTRQSMTELNFNFARVMTVMKTDSMRARLAMGGGPLMHILSMIDFPGFNFQTEVQPGRISMNFKEGKALKDYQVVGLNWLLNNWCNRRNSILADEMGLGKTIQVVSFINILVTNFKLRGPYLVIAPLSTLSHWKQTIEDWTVMNCVCYHDSNGFEGRSFCREYETYYTDITKKGGQSTKSKLVKFNVLITSYEVFVQDHDTFFSELPFQMVIMDEAHRLKNKKAKILQFLTELPVRRYILMTGTPLQNNTEELWSLLHFIEPRLFPSLQQFLMMYGNLETKEQVEQLQANIRPFLLRRLKEEVETSIPPLQETIIDVELTNIQKTYYRAIYERNRSFLCKGGLIPQLANMEMQLRKCCNHPYLIKGVEAALETPSGSVEEKMQKLVESSGKMVLLDKLLPKLKTQGKKVLIFSQFTQMLNLIEEYLHHHDYKFERLDGSIKASDRQASIERFNTEHQNVDVFLLSTRAGGLGINLASAQVVIIFDSDWNPQNDVQATARAHRIGQTEEVQVYRLITARTYETQMFERASRKLGLDQAVFLSKENKAEIENLLKFGAYSLLEEDGAKSKSFVESNIEDILSSNARVINYGTLRGSYTFSKSSFVSHGSDVSIDIEDPNFWSKILPAQASLVSRLQTRLNERSFIGKAAEAEFMQDLKVAVDEGLQPDSSLDSQNAEDKELLSSVLFQVGQDKKFSRDSRKLATQWMKDLTRPLRSRKKQRPESPRYVSESEDSSEEKPQKKVTSFFGTGVLCARCEKEGCGWFCAGPCRRGFHTQCKDKSLDITHDASTPENEEPRALDNLGWICKNCQRFKAMCFKCGEIGPFLAHKASDDSSKPLVKCSLSSCGKTFHLQCLTGNIGKKFTCPWHFCLICKGSGTSKSLVQCVRCPNAFHSKCYQRKAARLNRRFILCHEHRQPRTLPIYPNQKSKLVLVVKKIKEKMNKYAAKHAYLSSTKVSKRGRKKNKPRSGREDPKDIYEAHSIQPPEEFDYAAATCDWCRYCGARRAAYFSKGPWGPNTLCKAHHAAWKKKALSLSEHKDLPTTPISPESNTEIGYLMKQKDK